MSNQQPKGCLAVILRLFGIKLEASPRNIELPYRRRDDFLSAAELSFYRVLRLAVTERAVIFAKVNLADVFFIVRPQENRAYRNKIDRKHVDFLLCDPETIQPLLGLELDDASHKRANRVSRDQFVNSVFDAAGLPLVRIPAKRGYDPKELLAELTPHLRISDAEVTSSSRTDSTSSDPTCPKCGVPMVQRVASKGENKGKQFWGCPNFPRCREIA